MKIIWYIAQKDLLQTIKDKGSFFFLLALPIIFITVIGLAVGGSFGGSSGPVKITLAMNNQDSGFVGQTVVKALSINSSQLQITLNKYSNPNQVASVVADTSSNVDAGVVIPAGTTNALLNAVKNNQPVTGLVQFYTLPNTTSQPALIVQQLLNTVMGSIVRSEYTSAAAVGQVSSVCHASGNSCAPATINPQTISQAIASAEQSAAQTSPVTFLTAGKTVTISSFDLYVPGYAIFFAMFGINAVGGTILQEKEDGTFRRLLIAPIQKYSLLGGKLLAQFILTVLQISILFVFGYVFFHIHINNLPAIILLILGASFGVTGLGIILVSLVRTRRQLNPIVTLVTLISSIISGIFFPRWLEPTWLQQLSRIALPSWAIEGLNNVMIYGKDFSYVLPDILVLFAYGLVCYIIGIRLFRFQEKVA